MSVHEDQIVWREDGIAYRVRVLETRLTSEGGRTGSPGGGTSAPGVPGKPTNVAVTAQSVVQDHLGQTLIAVTVSWDGAADLWEIAWGEAV